MDLHADAGKPVKYRAGSPFSDLESIFFQIFLHLGHLRIRIRYRDHFV